MSKYMKLYNTVKYLKIKQVYFRIFYFVRNRFRNKIGFKYPDFKNINKNKLNLQPSINSYKSYTQDNTFRFLNLEKRFEEDIDWNYNSYGKLWTYNLTYFDYLNQENIQIDEALKLINDFINNDAILKDAYEPFPISLRGINWIKFLSNNAINKSAINESLYKQYHILLDNLEYHLLGNHLLENGFSLLFASFYFENEKFYQKAEEILISELNEQILNDGAHFELSPMYHQIMLFRVLDCINLIKNNNFKGQKLVEFLSSKASVMLSWLVNISYDNGDIPLLNDSAIEIAPTTQSLLDYAKSLHVEFSILPLSQSGYRKFKNKNYESIIDIGNIGPDYIPGHAHSDTFNFEVKIKNNPFIVDTGISTYETSEQRTNERSTKSHNTVIVNDKEQSEIWGGFRVANRAKVIALKEEEFTILASHNGYKKDNIIHTRKWEFLEKSIVVKDIINNESSSIAYLHFHPKVSKEKIINQVCVSEPYKIKTYQYCVGFNKYSNALKLEIPFKRDLKIEIKI